MTISRKGSYPIDVNGVTYRWSVSPRLAFDQELANSSLTFVVVHPQFPGSPLVVEVNVAQPDNWVLERSASVTPAIVDHAIGMALSQGWRPAAKGEAFALRIRVSRPSGSAPTPIDLLED